MGELTKILDGIPDCNKYIFIDSENISIQWLDMLEETIGEQSVYHEDDPDADYYLDDYPYNVLDPHFVVMYTDKTPHISYEDCIRLAKYIDLVTMIKCYPGEKASSALDFQMVSIIGYVLKGHADSEFVIVSKDKGYDPVVQLWKDAGYRVSREEPPKQITKSGKEDKTTEKTAVTSDATQPVGKELTQSEKKARREALLAEWLKGEKVEDRNAVKKILNKYSSKAKGNVYLEVVKKFGQKKGLNLYRKVKPHIKEYEELK